MAAAKLRSITITTSDIERRPEDKYARVPLERAMLIVETGIEGDLKGRGGVRQVNVMRAETLEELAGEGLKVSPGEMGEQMIIAGLNAEDLSEGERLMVGSTAILEVGTSRRGCDRFERIQNRTRNNVENRLGVLARVIQGGPVSIGDNVTVVGSGAIQSTPALGS